MTNFDGGNKQYTPFEDPNKTGDIIKQWGESRHENTVDPRHFKSLLFNSNLDVKNNSLEENIEDKAVLKQKSSPLDINKAVEILNQRGPSLRKNINNSESLKPRTFKSHLDTNKHVEELDRAVQKQTYSPLDINKAVEILNQRGPSLRIDINNSESFKPRTDTNKHVDELDCAVQNQKHEPLDINKA